MLGLPHAQVELAESEGVRGCVVLDFVGERADLIHGNELLWELDHAYPKEQQYHLSAHTIANVQRVLANPDILPPESGDVAGMTANEIFFGYLLLDALIGNTDRHHENWALVRTATEVRLAPTYDHASSLGRELQDAGRRDHLGRGIEKYARKARSALYAALTDRRALAPVAAFLAAAGTNSRMLARWQARLDRATPNASDHRQGPP